MNVRGLFTIVIKVLGLFMLPEIFSIANQFLQSWSVFNGDRDRMFVNVTYVGFVFATLVLYILVLRLMLFRTHILVNKITTTEDDLESEFSSFKIHRSTGLMICIIVVGGLTLVEQIPNLIKHIYVYKLETNDYSDNSSIGGFQFIILSGVKVLFGLYLVFNSRFIVNLIEYKQKQQSPPSQPLHPSEGEHSN
ncbi:MAG TPA: hypothetical protein VGC65_09880 [Bacteroidia bacterium]